MKKIALLFLMLILTLASSAQTNAAKKSQHLNDLVTIMQGSYTSERQAAADTSYYNISLKMVPIWKDKGHYLYVEQALATKQDKPYRVRIYKISQRDDNEFVSEIYTLNDEKAWIGKHNNPAAFERLNETDIELKSGCEVILKRQGPNKYSGQTSEKTCASELRGASYATSKVTISPDQIISWDQGFDSGGQQVWGAEKAGYIFEKIN